MEKIKIMISSTVKDLKGEREAVKDAFKNIEFVDVIGADTVNTSSISGNSEIVTRNMARDCDLYMLILGNKFGFQLSNGKSATEIEFDTALKNDPTKILVFKKEFEQLNVIDSFQQKFIDKVCNYYSGYWRTTFKHTHELKDLVLNSFATWIKQRASMGSSSDYLDQFIRIAKQTKPEHNAVVYYSLTEDNVDLRYDFFGIIHTIHFDRKQIYDDFWGCISKLQEQFERWLQ